MGTSGTEIFEGRFWPPHDRYRSYGRIEFDLERGVRLHLVDTNLTTWGETGPQAPGPVEVLHGELLGGMPITILDVYPTRWSVVGLPPTAGDVVDAAGDRMLLGVHVMEASQMLVSSTTSTLHGLKELLTGGEVDHGPLRPESGEWPRADTLVVEIDEKVRLCLAANWQTSWSRLEGERKELHALAQWTFDPPLRLPAIERDYLGVLQDLILFSTRRQSYVKTLTADVPDWERSVRILRRAHPKPRESPEVYALALNLADHDDPAGLIRSWYELRRRIGPVWGVFFSALDRPESLLEDRLLGLLAFAEGYHRALHDERPLSRAQARAATRSIKAALDDAEVRRVYKAAVAFANSQTQGERLEFLVRRALEVLEWYVEPGVFVGRLTHTRNWLVHWGKRQKLVVDDSAGMVELLRGLIVVLYVNILLDLGLSHHAAGQVIASGWRLEGLPEDIFVAWDE